MPVVCPACGHGNIEGVDACEHCQTDLYHLDLEPKTYTDDEFEKVIVKERIDHLPLRDGFTVSEDKPVGEVLEAMVAQHLGAAVVIGPEGNVVGIFTARDVILKMNDQWDAEEVLGRPISHYMTKEPETLNRSHKVVDALHKMNLRGYGHLPIVGEKGIALLGVSDVIKYIVNEHQDLKLLVTKL